jgi:GT2 family glycosyltransferase
MAGNPGPARDGRPAVSVVVCTRNRAPLLQRLLRSLASQNCGTGRFGLVIVDDDSEDGTPQVCRQYQDRFAALKYVRQERHMGTAAARNAGVTAASGSVVLFADDDCVADSLWVETMVQALRDRPIVAGAVATTTASYVELCHNIAQFYGFMPSRSPGPVGFIAGANMGFQRSVLEDVGPFDRRALHGEDIDYIFRARLKGHTPCFVPDAVVVHRPERHVLAHTVRYAMTHAGMSLALRLKYAPLLRTPLVLRRPLLLALATPLIGLYMTARIYLGDVSLLRHFPTVPVVFFLKVAWCLGALRAHVGLNRRRARDA